MSEVMIQVEGLTKDYGDFRAVNQISFEVRSGEVLGFLGPNGAGKSTTMKMLTCFLSPTAGTARVAGFDVYEQSLEVRQNLGYLPEDTPLYKDMSVLEYLEFICSIREVPRSERRPRLKRMVDVCGLGPMLGKLIGELSKGYRQRVGLAQAMIHEPKIVLLDEPTSGLDPNQIVEIRQLIKEVGRERTVILSTHILPEVQATCSRVVIIAGGRLVADGTPDELGARERGNRYRVVIEQNGTPAGESGAPSARLAIAEKLGQLPGVARCAEADGESGTYQFTVDGSGSGDLRKPLFRAAVDNGWSLLELQRQAASLEDVFRKLTRDDGVSGPKAQDTSGIQ